MGIKCDITRRRSDDDEYNPLEDFDEQVKSFYGLFNDFTEGNKFTVAENHNCKETGSINAVQSSLKPNSVRVTCNLIIKKVYGT